MKMELTKNSCVAEFIHEYYPAYNCSVEHRKINMLENIVMEDPQDWWDSERDLFNNECKRDFNIAKILYSQMERLMLETAISNYCDTKHNFSVWDFVEKYYPNYYSSADIVLTDTLDRIINDEIDTRSNYIVKMSENWFKMTECKRTEMYEDLHIDIHIKSIENFISKL